MENGPVPIEVFENDSWRTAYMIAGDIEGRTRLYFEPIEGDSETAKEEWIDLSTVVWRMKVFDPIEQGLVEQPENPPAYGRKPTKVGRDATVRFDFEKLLAEENPQTKDEIDSLLDILRARHQAMENEQFNAALADVSIAYGDNDAMLGPGEVVAGPEAELGDDTVTEPEED